MSCVRPVIVGPWAPGFGPRTPTHSLFSHIVLTGPAASEARSLSYRSYYCTCFLTVCGSSPSHLPNHLHAILLHVLFKNLCFMKYFPNCSTDGINVKLKKVNIFTLFLQRAYSLLQRIFRSNFSQKNSRQQLKLM